MRISDWSSDVCSSDLEVATSDLLADLVGSVLQALARGDDHGAIGVVTARRDEFGADAGQGRKRGAGKDTAPVPLNPILEACLPGGVRCWQPVQDQRGAVRADQPCPHQQNAALAVGDLTVVRSEEHTSELQSLMRLSYAV